MSNSLPKRITEERMPVRDAIQVLADVRGDDDVVITNQGAARVWPLIDRHPLDFHYNPSNMGGAVPFALGLALARAPREVLVLTGDGSLLMSLGCLVTVVGSGATNLSVIVLDNGAYEVTGGQKTPATEVDVDFAKMARAAGFRTVAQYGSAREWRSDAAGVLSATGPRFLWLLVDAAQPDDLTSAAIPMQEQIDRLRGSA
jgi:thiamine pyrophosphate-dependent acetolactate synthase large subunit-like protein